MDDNDESRPNVTLRMKGTDKRWTVLFNGLELGELGYYDIRPYVLGQKPKSELLARYGVIYEQAPPA